MEGGEHVLLIFSFFFAASVSIVFANFFIRSINPAMHPFFCLFSLENELIFFSIHLHLIFINFYVYRFVFINDFFFSFLSFLFYVFSCLNWLQIRWFGSILIRFSSVVFEIFAFWSVLILLRSNFD